MLFESVSRTRRGENNSRWVSEDARRDRDNLKMEHGYMKLAATLSLDTSPWQNTAGRNTQTRFSATAGLSRLSHLVHSSLYIQNMAYV